uniref:Protein FAR1-RELATED SEQUENCE n=1 Tax=Oryza brachyantha TaxID=4533 RepID=J3LQU9_ORYBR
MEEMEHVGSLLELMASMHQPIQSATLRYHPMPCPHCCFVRFRRFPLGLIPFSLQQIYLPSENGLLALDADLSPSTICIGGNLINDRIRLCIPLLTAPITLDRIARASNADTLPIMSSEEGTPPQYVMLDDNCEGKPKENQRSTTRCQCPARIRLLNNTEGKWYVKFFVNEHNHKLLKVVGEKRHIFSHKSIDPAVKDMIRHLRKNNVSLTKVNCILGSLHGSMDVVLFTKKSVRTICVEIAQENLHDDIRKTMELFQDLSVSDPDFKFCVQLDNENKIKSLMWPSGRSHRMYSHFGDMVTFDTTYQTNFYDMPFGMFLGINNPFQSVLFAGVLLGKDTDSFKWAFSEFAKMMGGPPLGTILTDQDLAMVAAIREVYPGTVHRWCKWHVLKDTRDEIGHVYVNNKNFRK